MAREDASDCFTRRQSYKLEGSESGITSIDSAYGSEVISPGFSTQSQENERSEFEFPLSDETVDGEGILPLEEEKRIRKKVISELKEEFRKIRQDAQTKVVEIRQDHKRDVNACRAILIKERLNAEEKAVDALEKRAEAIQEEITKKRALRTKEVINQKKSRRDHNFGADDEWAQEQIDDMVTLRKVQNDLERAKTRKRVGVSMALVAGKKGKFKLGNLLQTEIRRLERPDEIRKLAVEMDRLGLGSQAARLATTLEKREEKDVKLRVTLKEERAKTKVKVEMRKEDEIQKVRKERIAEWDTLERERKEREEKERLARMMAALKRKARNMQMWRDFDNTLLNSRISRSNSLSYFPSVRKSSSGLQRAKSGFPTKR